MPVVEAESGEQDTTNPQVNQRFQAVLKSLNNTSSGGHKQKCMDALDPYLFSAQFFCLNHDLFADFDAVIREGMLAEFDPDPDQDQSEYAQATRTYLVHVYKNFASTIPGFSELNTKFEADPDAWTGFQKAMENAANSARCDNTGSLKHNGLQYLLKDPAKDTFDPPILKTHSKAVRGWNHPATTRLLCPAHDIVEFDEDPNAYMDRVKSGQKKITAKQWPSMFYNMSLYNPKNKKAGFLRGHAIIQGWHHIFTGPMSALSKDRTHRSSKPTKGKMHNLTEPGPINIMYVAIQMYFVACNAESWTSEVGSMNLEEVYYTAVDLLLREHAEDQWVKDLLQFWKDEAAGLTQTLSKCQRVASNLASDSEDDMDDFFGGDDDEQPSAGGSTRDHEPARSAPIAGGNASTSGSGSSSTGSASASAGQVGMAGGHASTSSSGPSSTGSASASAGQAGTAGGMLEGGNVMNTGNIDDEDEEEQQQPRRRCRLEHDSDTQRERSPLTPPPTSPPPPSPHLHALPGLK
ncbi:uncharacterized protein F5891DRAFT_1192401 [Suillus fuscotomentosus]|uniref:Uncharacterized protein n=1 Tax=Suillus fuscotomentosus TaxID=1912939 RepID=A0AAD4E0C0_9AGAM|nr:uncharacterized protein F5891DRAFT_1192401 [Suillus fuscotomentosus]KAG1896987.1 hypothetical protein F5891DRAFT_1192401 [Suillus fuscotomentosus]